MEGIKKFAVDHPQITSWVVLAIGMVIILVLSARNVGFTSSQWVALIITTVLLAGACVWIIGWEDEEDEVVQEQAISDKVENEGGSPN